MCAIFKNNFDEKPVGEKQSRLQIRLQQPHTPKGMSRLFSSAAGTRAPGRRGFLVNAVQQFMVTKEKNVLKLTVNKIRQAKTLQDRWEHL
jgi:hypothetical protein